MQLIVITPERNVANEAAVVSRLFEQGLQRLHLRKPLFTTEQTREYLAAIAPEFHERIVLSGNFELLSEFALGGIHLNSAMKSDENTWMQIRDMQANTLSASFHSWQEIVDNEVFYSYVFISPVFDSISKTGYKAGIDLNGAREIKTILQSVDKRCPDLIGLGGVGVPQLTTLHHHGFDGAAMLGAIWQSADPVKEFTKAGDVVKTL